MFRVTHLFSFQGIKNQMEEALNSATQRWVCYHCLFKLKSFQFKNKSNISILCEHAFNLTSCQPICCPCQTWSPNSKVEPSDTRENGAAQETTVTKKKRGKRRERTRKVKEIPVNQLSTSHDPSPRQRTQATQTDNGQPEKTMATAETQTRSPLVQDKSTQTPGIRFAREPLSTPQALATPAPLPIQPPLDQLPRDQVPPSPPASPQGPQEKQSRRTSKRRDPNELFVLTWNIDGLDREDMDERFPKLLHYLSRWVMWIMPVSYVKKTLGVTEFLVLSVAPEHVM